MKNATSIPMEKQWLNNVQVCKWMNYWMNEWMNKEYYIDS